MIMGLKYANFSHIFKLFSVHHVRFSSMQPNKIEHHNIKPRCVDFET